MAKNEQKEWWWIAVNGPTCAPAPMASKARPDVSPRAPYMYGFSTKEEQQHVTQVMLTGELAKVREWMRTELVARINRGEVMYHHCPNAEPYTKGTTAWTFAPVVDVLHDPVDGSHSISQLN